MKYYFKHVFHLVLLSDWDNKRKFINCIFSCMLKLKIHIYKFFVIKQWLIFPLFVSFVVKFIVSEMLLFILKFRFDVQIITCGMLYCWFLWMENYFIIHKIGENVKINHHVQYEERLWFLSEIIVRNKVQCLVHYTI